MLSSARLCVLLMGWGVSLVVLGLITSCQTASPVERPTKEWYLRSVVDLRPRMMTLALDEEMYVAYDLERCALYKTWKGGLALNGATFNNLKTVQPTSWGITYQVDSLLRPRWTIEQDGKHYQPEVTFAGYTIESNKLTYQYRFILSQSDTCMLYEYPEYVANNEKQISLVRTFIPEDFPENIKISFVSGGKKHVLDSHIPTEVQHVFERSQQNVQPPQLEADQLTNKGKYWLERSGCNTCHEMDYHTIGPGYRQIAERYTDDEKTAERLVQKVIAGGSGNWGEVPMSPHPQHDKAALMRMVNYILSLDPVPVEEKSPIQKVAVKSTFVSEKDQKPDPHPGWGAPLEDVHPSYDLITIRPSYFKPRVGAMDFLPDGRLLVSTWDSVGAVYMLDGLATNDTQHISVTRIAQGLAEPLGIKVVDGEIFVLQKQELTQLIDHDGDEVIDEYKAICNGFGVTADFHEFAYGLAYKEGYFYANLGLAMRLMSHESQHPDRGRTIRIARNGDFEWVNHGLRQPNGIGEGLDGELFITENQGRWVPSCKVIHLQEDVFHGCRLVLKDSLPEWEMKPPAVWLPQDEIGNSPGQPVYVEEGPYAGQMLHGEVTHGGIKRVFLEKVQGEYQGCVFRFTQGLEAGINRLCWGADGGLYAGGVGMNGNWGWNGNQYGLQKLMYNGQNTFEMLAVRALPNGVEIEMTAPIAQDAVLTDIQVQQWGYTPTAQYGGPKIDLEELAIQAIKLSDDRKKITLILPDITTQRVIYIRLPDGLESHDGKLIWSTEAWYTLNKFPQHTPEF